VTRVLLKEAKNQNHQEYVMAKRWVSRREEPMIIQDREKQV
jgi:hypothetical protein